MNVKQTAGVSIVDGSPSRNTMNGILAKINDRAFQELEEYSPGEACMIITREVDRLDQLTTVH